MLRNKSLSHLSKDPVINELIRTIKLSPWPKPDFSTQALFADIVETILGQQLSGKAAETITNRFKNLFGGRFPKPKELLVKPDSEIRNCGTSWSKIKYIKNAAKAVLNISLNLKELSSQPDEVVYEELLKIKGIGRWTAEMVLMFTLGREDVFSPGDAGLKNAMGRLYKIKQADTKRMEKIAVHWRPYRTLACRYLWKSLEKK